LGGKCKKESNPRSPQIEELPEVLGLGRTCDSENQ